MNKTNDLRLWKLILGIDVRVRIFLPWFTYTWLINVSRTAIILGFLNFIGFLHISLIGFRYHSLDSADTKKCNVTNLNVRSLRIIILFNSIF